jgi:ribosomal protein S17
MPSVPRIRVGTVSRVGTMSKTVQITFNTEYFDKWFKRRMQQPRHILAHEPTGYLRAGDVVHFARFTPATMTDRFESGKLDRRGGGVRFEVHRVMTPFGEALEDRKELQGEGELWEKFSTVEFERRKAELARPWNQNRERKVALLEGMWEALETEMEEMKMAGLTLKASDMVDDAADESRQDHNPGADEDFKGMSDADRDIARQLQRLQGDSPSAPIQQI